MSSRLIKSAFFLPIILAAVLILQALISSPKRDIVSGVVTPNFESVEEMFTEYGATLNSRLLLRFDGVESEDFHLTQGGIRWFAGGPGTVRYQISGPEPVPGANGAVASAITRWDGFITTRAFGRDDESPSLNPCGGVNKITWAFLDGPDEVVAQVAVCRNVATKEITGFRMTMDSAESWSVGFASSGYYDVENAASHEFGHVAGLSHVNMPRSVCLTMYKLINRGETGKRSLGWGDKLGMDKLYQTGNISPGPGCGS